MRFRINEEFLVQWLKLQTLQNSSFTVLYLWHYEKWVRRNWFRSQGRKRECLSILTFGSYISPLVTARIEAPFGIIYSPTSKSLSALCKRVLLAARKQEKHCSCVCLSPSYRGSVFVCSVQCVCVCVCVCVCTYQHNLFLYIPKLLPLCKVAHFYLGIQELSPAQFSTIQEIKCLNVCLIDIRMHCFQANIKNFHQSTSMISCRHFFLTNGRWIRRRRIHLTVPAVVWLPAAKRSMIDWNKLSSEI